MQRLRFYQGLAEMVKSCRVKRFKILTPKSLKPPNLQPFAPRVLPSPTFSSGWMIPFTALISSTQGDSKSLREAAVGQAPGERSPGVLFLFSNASFGAAFPVTTREREAVHAPTNSFLN